MKLVANKISDYLDVLENHYGFDLKMMLLNDRLLAETPFNQKWEFGIQILFSSIYTKEKFYLNVPALNLNETAKMKRFIEEMEVTSKIVIDLNELVDEWRRENE